ncbi:polymorphic toxin-type HINT domain-containing protein [Azospira restricta]|uniref:polymorphic toxin-type HINT domain-containing protein n=1 Tax=Azospira restricta TaxID=404405 RepID=UPI00366F4EBE
MVAIQTALETIDYLRSDYRKLQDNEIEIQLDGLSSKLALLEHAFSSLGKELTAAQRHISQITCNPSPRIEGCFIAGTLVRTIEGPVSIEKIQPGHQVLTQADEGTNPAYRKVTRIVSSESKAIWVIKARTFDAYKPKEFQEPLIHNLYAAEFHPFWVEGIGWTAARYLKSGHRLRLADGGYATVETVWPVLRTPIPGVGWVSKDIAGAYDGLQRAHIVDFRDGCNLWHYHWLMDEHCGIPYCEGLAWGKDEGLFDSGEFSEIFYGDSPNFYAKTFNLELEGSQTYFAGELGVWVHNTNCAQG